MSLLQTTRTKLARAIRRGITLAAIAKRSRGKVDYEWLKKFWADKIVEPGVDKTENLHTVLVGIEASIVEEETSAKRRSA